MAKDGWSVVDGVMEPTLSLNHEYGGCKIVVNGKEYIEKPADSPKPAIVCLREDGKLYLGMHSQECKSTNAAFALAETWANDNPGNEYVVFQEKGSRRVEKPKTNADRFEERCMSDAFSRESFNLLDDNDAVVATGKTIGVIRDGETIVVTYDVSGF